MRRLDEVKATIVCRQIQIDDVFADDELSNLDTNLWRTVAA